MLGLVPVDPFELPDWLGEGDVTWYADDGIRRTHHVHGRLRRGDGAGEELACDLYAVDRAFPVLVADDECRHEAHQAWHLDQVLLTSYDDRLVLAVPARTFSADLVLDTLARLAKAVGARPESYVAALRIGTPRSH